MKLTRTNEIPKINHVDKMSQRFKDNYENYNESKGGKTTSHDEK